jgi:hypothetical protein
MNLDFPISPSIGDTYEGFTWDGVKWLRLGATAAQEELAYAERTTTANVTATVEASADTVLTAGSVAVDGSTDVIVEFFSPFLRADNAAADRNLSLFLFDNGVSVGRIAFVRSTSFSATGLSYTAAPGGPALARRRLRPSAGSHAYSIRAIVNAGTGIVLAGAGGVGVDVPAYIRVTRVAAVPLGGELPPVWVSYTPVWTAEGVTQPTLGNGSLTGRYVQIGKTVHMKLRLVFGSTTVVAGTSTWYFTLPVAAASADWSGPAVILDAGTDNKLGAAAVIDATRVSIVGEGINVVADGVPMAWATSDQLKFNLTYEAA